MAPLRAAVAIVAALALAPAGPAHADAAARWRPYITEASTRFGVPAAWIVAVMRAESGGRTLLAGRPIRSRAGAIGLMQLMPATWAEMRGRLGLDDDPDDPRSNILAGALYLRLMHDRFGYPGLFAAYNAGPARYAEHLAAARPLPAETVAYLAMVGGTRQPGAATAPRDRLFFAVRGSPTASAAPRPEQRGSLFVALSPH